MDFATLGPKNVAEIERIEKQAEDDRIAIMVFALGNPETGKIQNVLYTTAPDLPEVIQIS